MTSHHGDSSAPIEPLHQGPDVPTGVSIQAGASYVLRRYIGLGLFYALVDSEHSCAPRASRKTIVVRE